MNLARGVLVTGAGGLVGRHLTRELERRGIPYRALTRADGDLRDLETARALFRSERGRAAIVHLAAWQAAGEFPQRRPGEILLRNARIHLNVLEAWRCELPEAKLVALGTSCAYPTKEGRLREDELLAGPIHGSVRFYGQTRRLLHEGIAALNQEFGLDGSFVVPATMFGEGDDFDERTAHVAGALTARFVKAADEGRQEVEVWGDGTQVRDFLYAGDFARVLCDLLPLLSRDVVNVGPGCGITIADLARRIARAAGFGGRIRFAPERYTGVRAKVLDVTRLKERYGIEAPEPGDEAFARTAAWYRAHRFELEGRPKFAEETEAPVG